MKLNYPNCLLGLLLCFSFLSYGQVGVNTTNPQAQLDVVASNPSLPSNTDGFLVPRIDVFPATNPTASQQGMLVYLTTVVGINQPGFYFWDNTTVAWKPIAVTSASNDWSLTGNSGTTSGTNFIGTTDNQSLDIRTNNAIKVRITSKGQIEILNTGDSVFIGQNAGLNDDLTNNENVFIGQSAGQNNTTGSSNVGVGKQSLFNTTSSNNTALGNYSGESLTTGFNNSIFGESAMRNSVSNFRNVAVGSSALRNNISGNENTALGSEAGRNNIVGSGNVFIGNQAGQDETNSNKLYIDNSSTANPLIYGDFATNLLQVNGTLNVNNAYNLPTTAGASNQVLQTDGAGNTAWVNPTVVAETDPQVSSTTTNYIPKWNGTTLVDGQVFDDGTNIGVGTITPTSKVHVVGNIKVDAGKIPFVNTGGSVFIGDNAGLNDDLSSNVNTYVGTNAGRNNTIGSGNVAIGLGASQATTLGLQNVALGSNSLKNNLVGSSNTAVGTFAGENATGSSNLFLGYTTGQFATGNANVFIGNSAGQNETGSNKLYIDNSNTVNPLLYGDFAANLLRVNGTLNVNNAYNLPTTAGTVNQVLQTDGAGNSSWVNPTTLANNSWSLTGNSGTTLGTNFIGSIDDVQLSFRVNNSRSGLISNSTTSSTFFGYQAGGTGTANNNSAFGHQALNGLTNGNNNTANGYQSLFSNTNGISNTALGYRTLYNNVSGNQNVAIGNQALNSNTGNTNTAIGSSSMFSNTTGNNNVSSGFNAMYGNISGSQNVGLGTESLMSNTSGGNNVAVGYRALYSNTTTFNNNAVGSGSLQNNASGSLNNAFGTGALFNNTSGNNNVAFGHQAGYLSTGNRNVFLGYSAGYNETGNDKLYIDNSNTVNPLIYGDFATDLLRVNGTLNVNNAYNLPTTSGTANQVLQTNGAGVASWVNPSSLTITETDPQVSSTISNKIPRWNGTSLVDGAMMDDGSFVGIGATIPQTKLHVVGTVRVEAGRLDFRNTGGTTAVGTDAGINDDQTNNYNTYVGYFSGKASTSGYDNVAIGAGSLENNSTGFFNTAIGRLAGLNNSTGYRNVFLGYAAGYNETGSDKLYIDNSSTSNPLIYGDFDTNLLRVNGTLNINNAYNLPTTAGTANQILQTDGAGNTSWIDSSTLTVTETDPQVSSIISNYVPRWNGTALVDGKVYDNGFNIGIGTTNPNALLTIGDTMTPLPFLPKLSVNTTGNLPLFIGETTGQKGLILGYDGNNIQGRSGANFTSNNDLILNNYGGNVGVGTAAPTEKLDINGKTKTTNVQITNGATNGYVLQSDAAGNGIWVNPTSLSITETDPQVSSSGVNYVPRWIGTTLDDGSIQDDGSAIGIATAPVAGNRVTVNGKTRTTNLQMTNGATNGYVLQSDAAGNGTWVNPTSLSITETDPQVASVTTNRVPKWNGTSLVDGQIFDSGTAVGIGNNTPNALLSVGVNISPGLPFVPKLSVNTTGNLPVFVGESISQKGMIIGYDGNSIQGRSGANFVLNSDLILNNYGGNVGIGTTTPTDKVHVLGNLKIDAGKLPFINTGASVFIGNAAGLNDNLTANNNVNIGENSGKDNIAGEFNTSIGANSLNNNLNSYNTAVGNYSLNGNVNGYSNVAIGNYSGNNSSGFGNVFIGSGSGENTTGSSNVFIGFETGLGSTASDKLYIDNSSTINPLVWGDFASNVLAVNGSLGVGTTTPTQAKLVVSGFTSNSVGNFGQFKNDGTGSINTTGTPYAYSIYASNRIAASEFNAFSDARIKNIKGISNGKLDLETLSKIEITNYTLKDSISKGNNNYKKVIAQQVEKVYPQAVSKLTDVIPDIYQQAEMINGFIALKNDLKKGEKVKIITQSDEQIVDVLEANSNGFKIDSNQTEKIFVYGRQVDDFRSVDYEALSTLNISATQELLKRIEHLEQENTTLKASLNEVSELKTEMENIKKMLSKEQSLNTNN